MDEMEKPKPDGPRRLPGAWEPVGPARPPQRPCVQGRSGEGAGNRVSVCIR